MRDILWNFLSWKIWELHEWSWRYEEWKKKYSEDPCRIFREWLKGRNIFREVKEEPVNKVIKNSQKIFLISKLCKSNISYLQHRSLECHWRAKLTWWARTSLLEEIEYSGIGTLILCPMAPFALVVGATESSGNGIQIVIR